MFLCRHAASGDAASGLGSSSGLGATSGDAAAAWVPAAAAVPRYIMIPLRQPQEPLHGSGAQQPPYGEALWHQLSLCDSELQNSFCRKSREESGRWEVDF